MKKYLSGLLFMALFFSCHGAAYAFQGMGQGQLPRDSNNDPHAGLDLNLAKVSGAGKIVVSLSLIEGEKQGKVQSSPLANEVILSVYRQNQLYSSQKKRSNRAGRVIFDQLSREQGFSYGLTANYQGIDYYSSLINFPPQKKEVNYQLKLYHKSNKRPRLLIKFVHLVSSKPLAATGQLKCHLNILLVNQSNYSWQASAKEERALDLPLPLGASNITVGGDLKTKVIESPEPGLVFDSALVPGDRRIFVSFSLPYKNKRALFKMPLIYPSEKWMILAEGEQLSFVGEELLQLGKKQMMQGRVFNAAEIPAKQAGEVISFSIEGKRRSRFATRYLLLFLLLPLAIFLYLYDNKLKINK